MFRYCVRHIDRSPSQFDGAVFDSCSAAMLAVGIMPGDWTRGYLSWTSGAWRIDVF